MVENLHDFQKSDVYKRPLLFTKRLREVTNRLPKEELYSFSSGIRFVQAMSVVAVQTFLRSRSISRKEYQELVQETDAIV